MKSEIKQRIEQIKNGQVPVGYKKTKVGTIPEEWIPRKLGEVAKYRNGKAHENDISETGKYIVVNSKFVSTDGKVQKYSNIQIEPLFKNEIAFVLSDVPNGRAIARTFLVDKDDKYTLNQRIAGITPSEYVCPYYLNILMNRNRYFLQFDDGVKQTNLSITDVMEFEEYYPPSEEQEKIAEILSTQDKLIELYQRKIDELQKLKKIYLSKMFPQKGKNVPEWRFPQFTDVWEQRKLGDMMNVTSVKRIHQSDWTDSGIRFLRARDIVSAAKNEEPEDYLYISKEKYDEYSLVSGKVAIGDMLVTGVGTIGVPYLIRNTEPLYFKDGNIIWFQNGSKIDGDFFLYSFFGKAIQDFINESAGIGTVGTYTIESGKKTPISLPEMKEQKQIGAFFHNLDNLITLHQRKLEEMKKQKKALMQLLLTGIVRVAK